MRSSLLVTLFGFRATLIHGDLAVLDRWLWLRSLLPLTGAGEKLLDVGCGTGAFTMGAALRGYDALGLTWNEEDTAKAMERTALCGAKTASFRVLDARRLDGAGDLRGAFDVVVCCEMIEHVLDDRKLFRDLAACLRPGGRLLLTTPWFHYPPQSRAEIGPFATEECGWHVRRGYTASMLTELCDDAGLSVERISYGSGFLTQKLTALLWTLEKVNRYLAWLFVLPFRPLAPLLDPWIARLFGWRPYAIRLEAYKPRFN